ncbi:hypothetical protein [Fusobacterium necrophorum]|uniref:hypothetical protein n=2 Tax=Fusobacterium necrophorum TaxID=859 RepID=UPI0012444781|nr:hypothetical protein [Fusobacterium necrophorum]KAB0553194.1 hypothetical protein F7P76_05040 [Fusobacterium necrophorum subsp. funduliforme]
MLKDFLFLITPMIFSYFMFTKAKNFEAYSKKYEEEKILLKEKLEKIYLPIYLKHTSEILIREKFIVLQADANSIYYFETLNLVDTILSKNLSSIPTETQKLFLEFHINLHNSCINNLHEVEPSELAEDEFLLALFNSLDTVYKKLYKSLMKEYKDICRKLNLEEPVEKFD